mmetsp:Transcript_24003/g.26647  ORF Transcript_24003/g.26647 Transcript_24003/m.26647 type:complete len:280 (-) Transcript_24003:40-879(-)
MACEFTMIFVCCIFNVLWFSVDPLSQLGRFDFITDSILSAMAMASLYSVWILTLGRYALIVGKLTFRKAYFKVIAYGCILSIPAIFTVIIGFRVGIIMTKSDRLILLQRAFYITGVLLLVFCIVATLVVSITILRYSRRNFVSKRKLRGVVVKVWVFMLSATIIFSIMACLYFVWLFHPESMDQSLKYERIRLATIYAIKIMEWILVAIIILLHVKVRLNYTNGTDYSDYSHLQAWYGNTGDDSDRDIVYNLWDNSEEEQSKTNPSKARHLPIQRSSLM